jgi:hypothetical protein
VTVVLYRRTVDFDLADAGVVGGGSTNSCAAAFVTAGAVSSADAPFSVWVKDVAPSTVVSGDAVRHDRSQADSIHKKKISN